MQLITKYLQKYFLHLKTKFLGINNQSENIVVLSSTDEDLFVDYINALENSDAEKFKAM